MKMTNNFNTRNIKDYNLEGDTYTYSFSDLTFDIIRLDVNEIYIRLYEEEEGDLLICQDFIIQVKSDKLKKLIERRKNYKIANDKRYINMLEKIVYMIVKDRNVLELFNIYDRYLQLKKEMSEQFYGIQVVI